MNFLSNLSLIELFSSFVLGSFVSYLFFSGFAFYFSEEYRNEAITRDVILRQIKQSFMAILMIAPISAAIQYCLWRGKIGFVYYDFEWSFEGLSYYVGSFLAYLVCVDCLYFWSHRMMHLPWLYKNFHSVHHQYKPVTTFTTSALDFTDALIGAVFSLYLPAMVIPVHPSIVFMTLLHSLLWSLYLHNNIGRRMQNTILCDNEGHLLHHKTGRFNYGFYFTFWDKLCGTLK